MGLLADVVLVVHAAFVTFVVGGLLAIWVGAWRGWRWVRSLRLRIAHLAAIAFVALETLIGMACPLTVLEDWLRMEPVSPAPLIERWLHRLLFWDFPAWLFTVAYLGFAALVALTFVLVPPRSGAKTGRP